MEGIDENTEYLIHARVDCTWEKDEVIEPAYSKFIRDYQSKFHDESDLVKVEENFDDVHTTQVEGSFSVCGNHLAEDFCNDTNFKEDTLVEDVAETALLSTQTGDFSVKCKPKTDGSTSKTKGSMRDKKSSLKPSLQKHQKRHSAEKPYSCSRCSYTCSYKSNLTKHMYTHSNEKPFSCSHCSYSCLQKSHLIIHMYTHGGEKPYSCSHCSYTCSQRSHLVRHMRTHSREKPFSCDHCSYSCSQKSHLITHMYTHSREKPFSCSECSYSCSQKVSLTRHMHIHSGEKTDP